MKRFNTSIICVMTGLLLGIPLVTFSETKTNTIKSTVNDSVITAKVKSQFMTNDEVKASSINVETVNRVVKLTGVVDSSKEAITAVKIAQATPDVRDVDTQNLHVKKDDNVSQVSLRDDFITAKLLGLIARENILPKTNADSGKLNILTQNGDVILSGYLETNKELNRVVEIAHTIPEVKSVVSNVIVNK